MRKIILVLMVCFGMSSFSQNKKIDSLKNELKKDNVNLNNYFTVINYYTNLLTIDSIEKYSLSYYEMSKKSDKKENYVESLLYLSNYYKLKNDIVKKKYYFNECMRQSKIYKFDRLLSSCYFMLARDYYDKSQSKECLENALKSLPYYEKMGLKGAEMTETIYVMIIMSYKNLGNLQKANEYLIKQKRIVRNAGLKYKEIRIAQGEIAILEAKNQNDKVIKVSIDLIKKIKTYNNEYLKNTGLVEQYFNLASKFSERNNINLSRKYLDSSKFSIQKMDKFYIESITPYYKNLEAELLIKEKKIDNATLETIEYSKNSDESFNNAKNHTLKGDFYKQKKDYLKSIEEYEISKELYIKKGFKNNLGNLLKQLIELNILAEDSTKAIAYLKDYSTNNKEIFNEQVAKSITASEIKYETELKESQIKTQQLQIEQEKTNKYMAFGGIGFLILLSGGGFLWFKNQQKQKELLTQNTLFGLRHNINSMELQNLNQQLNPHEIKNLLASISPEIQDKAPESYKKMLQLFNLTKASLNSNSITDSVENQVQQIEGFLSLEKNMLLEPLEYAIDNKIENHQTQIPRLLLKNLVENAIKHGIKGQENGGEIKVILQENNGFINIEIDDTGKGRQHAISLDSGIGTSTYQKLFATLNPKNKENATFEIIDKEQGTKVEVKIPVDYKYS